MFQGCFFILENPKLCILRELIENNLNKTKNWKKIYKYVFILITKREVKGFSPFHFFFKYAIWSLGT